MIRDRSMLLRGQVEEAATEARRRAGELQRSGQEFVEQQKGRVERTARATSRAAKEAWMEEAPSS
jgi:hypothetical protein